MWLVIYKSVNGSNYFYTNIKIVQARYQEVVQAR